MDMAGGELKTDATSADCLWDESAKSNSNYAGTEHSTCCINMIKHNLAAAAGPAGYRSLNWQLLPRVAVPVFATDVHKTPLNLS